METDIVIYAVVAVGLVLWLRNILGTRNGSERERPNPFLGPPPAAPGQARPGALQKPAPALPAPGDWRQGLERNMAVADEAVENMVALIEADRTFDVSRFLRGAQDAFVMIVEAFARGDRATLRDLLADNVYAAFDQVVSRREAEQQSVAVEIHAVRRAEVTRVMLAGRQASVTVRFTSDQTEAVRDQAGAVIAGNPDRVAETIDVWTFARDLKSRDPAWRVTETREEEADALGLPDAG